MEQYDYDLIDALQYEKDLLNEDLDRVQKSLGKSLSKDIILGLRNEEYGIRARLLKIDRELLYLYEGLQSHFGIDLKATATNIKDLNDTTIEFNYSLSDHPTDLITLKKTMNNVTYQVNTLFYITMIKNLQNYLDVINYHCGIKTDKTIDLFANFMNSQFIKPFFEMNENTFNIDNYKVEIDQTIYQQFTKTGTHIKVHGLYLDEKQADKLYCDLYKHFKKYAFLDDVINLNVVSFKRADGEFITHITYNFNNKLEVIVSNLLEHNHTLYHQHALSICMNLLSYYCK